MSAARVMKETGCGAIKLEGGRRMAETIAFLAERGIPVMGHVGLTPQSINALGGFRTQGRDQADWAPIEADARAVAEAGAFAMVIEAVAEPLAAKITREVAIPTIGIGASAACDGQILVLEDMLGLSPRVPKFVKRYSDLGPAIDARWRPMRPRCVRAASRRPTMFTRSNPGWRKHPECGGFEVPIVLAARSHSNFKSKTTLESYIC